MTVPTIYRKSPEGQVASYSTVDYLLRKGFIALYGFRSGSSRFLSTTNIFHSNYWDASGNSEQSSSAGESSANDFDFDIEVNNSVILDGTAVVQVPIYGAATTGQTLTSTLTVELYRDDGTETFIASGAVPLTETLSGNDRTARTYVCAFDIPRTQVFVGDTLRTTIKTSASAGTEVGIIHDPTGTDWDANVLNAAGGTITQPNSTQFILNLPSVLEL